MTNPSPLNIYYHHVEEIWQVQVRGGNPEVNLAGPIRLGGPALYLNGPDKEPQDVHHHHPLEYAPVGLSGGGGSWLNIVTNRPGEDNYDIHRQMFHILSVEFNNLGSIEVEGFELHDNRPIRALWDIEPYQPATKDDTE